MYRRAAAACVGRWRGVKQRLWETLALVSPASYPSPSNVLHLLFILMLTTSRLSGTSLARILKHFGLPQVMFAKAAGNVYKLPGKVRQSIIRLVGTLMKTPETCAINILNRSTSLAKCVASKQTTKHGGQERVKGRGKAFIRTASLLPRSPLHRCFFRDARGVMGIADSTAVTCACVFLPSRIFMG